MKAAALVLLLAASVAIAGVVTTETQGPHVLHSPNGIKQTYKTHEACVAAAALGKSTCSDVTNIEKVANCEGVAPPVDPPQYNENGALVLPDLVVSDDWTTNMDRGYVWTGIMPTCWAPGLVPHVEYIAPDLPPVQNRSMAGRRTRAVSDPRQYFKPPLRFVEPADDQSAATIVDADGNAVAMLYWPGHPIDQTEAAEQATYELGRRMAAVL